MVACLVRCYRAGLAIRAGFWGLSSSVVRARLAPAVASRMPVSPYHSTHTVVASSRNLRPLASKMLRASSWTTWRGRRSRVPAPVDPCVAAWANDSAEQPPGMAV